MPCRERLFELINDLPTCYETVSGKAGTSKPNGKKRPAPSSSGHGKPLSKQPKLVRRRVTAPLVTWCFHLF